MSLPFSTFDTMVARLRRKTANKISTTIVGEFVNSSYKTLLATWEWSARTAEGLVTTVDDYTTGTVVATQGSTTITGTSTVWTAAMTGRYIRIGSSETFYGFTRVSNTSGTLSTAWAEADVSAASFVLFQYLYDVDATAGEVGQILLPTDGQPIEERTMAWVNRMDAARRTTGDAARYWIGHGVDASGNYQIEFWPRYSGARAIRVPFRKRVDDISGSTQPIIRHDVIEALALIDCYDLLYTEFGDAQYAKQADTARRDFSTLFEIATREDLPRHNLPHSIDALPVGPANWQSYVTEDWG